MPFSRLAWALRDADVARRQREEKERRRERGVRQMSAAAMGERRKSRRDARTSLLKVTETYLILLSERGLAIGNR
ncbi:hypothetical protein NDU88_002583 [Pleurodeles waltl]|uniref:Uncharacterized protein n=1 Tax=Pleurodeles waltl TaxID=8319 RepID=A0AAV7M3S5_PLEWA|nr:hypothetical protein NDU88_002583 [Pleurodeles waltl]